MSKYNLNVFLIKDAYDNFSAVIRDGLTWSEYNLREEYQLEGVIYIGSNSSNHPDWLNLLRTGSLDEIPDIINSSTRAVILIKRQGRLFLFAFGFGRFMIKDEATVKDFGIKVVLNSVNPLKLRSLDTTKFDELTVNSRTQTSRSTSVSAFGIDIARDLLRSVTGKPNNTDLGTVITGRESVQFTYDIDSFSDFATICDYLYERYTSIEYRNNFDWYDNLQMVSDPVLLSNLNARILEAINTQDENKFHLAPYEVINWTGIGGFYFTECGQKNGDLLVQDYFNYVNHRIIDLNKLKRQYIHVWNSDRTDIIQRWRLYECIVFETQEDDDLFILTVGNWFRVEGNFATTVRNYVQTIPDANIILPPCRNNENEGEYNVRVGSEIDNIITLHTREVPLGGSRIEVCDLLTTSGQFIHVKPWKSSSTLSHLFAQGSVSAISLLEDIGFRRDIRSAIEEVDAQFTTVINEAGINPEDLEIIFAIIDSDDRPLEERLPFFSKLNMMHTVRMLRNLRFKVSKYKIPRTA